jgi:flavin-dependent dehydrogenase
LTKQLYNNKEFKLRENCEPQKYALGVKEIWEVDPKVFNKGEITHTRFFEFLTFHSWLAFGFSNLWRKLDVPLW